jgi:Metallopeptidase toxin 2
VSDHAWDFYKTGQPCTVSGNSGGGEAFFRLPLADCAAFAEAIEAEGEATEAAANAAENIKIVEESNQIYIVNTKNKKWLLSDYPFAENASALATLIMQKYAKALGIPRLALRRSEKPSSQTPAFTLSGGAASGDVCININGGINPDLNQKYQLISALYHEKLHQEKIAASKDKKYEISSFLEHAEEYLKQIQHESFEKCTKGWKQNMVGNFCQRLLSHLVKNPNSTQAVLGAVDSFNKLSFIKLIPNFSFPLDTSYLITIKGLDDDKEIFYNKDIENYEN